MGNCFGRMKDDYRAFDTNEDAFDITVEEPSHDVPITTGRSEQHQQVCPRPKIKKIHVLYSTNRVPVETLVQF